MAASLAFPHSVSRREILVRVEQTLSAVQIPTMSLALKSILFFLSQMDPLIGKFLQLFFFEALSKLCVPSFAHKRCPTPCTVDALLAGGNK